MYENALEVEPVNALGRRRSSSIFFISDNISLLKPLLSVQSLHLFDRYLPRLLHLESHVGGHDEHHDGKDEDNAELHGTQHGQEGLGNHEGHEQVDGADDAKPHRPALHREGLVGNEPFERTP